MIVTSRNSGNYIYFNDTFFSWKKIPYFLRYIYIYHMFVLRHLQICKYILLSYAGYLIFFKDI